MMLTRTIVLAAAACAAAAAGAGLSAQGPRTVWDGVFTATQAERGWKSYVDQCSTCHGAEMKAGAGAPSLAGPEFQFSWNKKSVGELFDYAQNYMPPGQAGTLSSQQYADIVASVLRTNGFPASDGSELPAAKTDLDTIAILAAKP